MPGAFTLRPVQPGDEAFLREVFASTRAQELALLNWSDVEKEAFLRMQFDAQHRHYHSHFAGADFLVVECDGLRIGRLYLARLPEEFRIIDLALLPQHRNRGVGSSLLRSILDEAALAAKPVRIHVEGANPARRLYERLGFVVIAEGPVYRLMEKHPDN